MTWRSLIRVLTVCAATGWAQSTTAAPACENGRCEAGAQAAGSKPLKLKTFMRKPVASSATRTVKKKNGEYVKVTTKRRFKQRPAAPPVAAETDSPAPTISPAAAQAFASYELARVRVVTPEQANDQNLLSETPTASLATTVISVDNVQVARADEVNDIDRQADSPSAVSLDALSRDLAASAPPMAESTSWFQHMLMVLGGAFAAVAALVRILLS